MNRPLRIGMFVGVFPALSETFILRQITGLLDLGHEVELFADARAQPTEPVHPAVAKYGLLDRTTFIDMPPECAPWELPVWPLAGKTWVPGESVSKPNWRRVLSALPAGWRCAFRHPALTARVLRPSQFGYQARSLSALYRLARLTERHRKYDVLHAHFGPVGNSFRFARDLWGAPLLVSFHGYDFSTQPRQEGPDMYAALFQTVDLVTVNSSYTQTRLEKLGCPVGKLRRLPVGLDLEQFPFRERRLAPGEVPRLLTVARLVPIKGHEYVLRALGRLREQGVVLRYDVVGDGPLRRPLEELTRQLGLAGNVTFHGAQAGSALTRFYEQAHLFALCSMDIEGDQEGQGLVLQEAQACGLPVVATAHGALPEGLLPDQSGVVVPQRDIEALVRALAGLIERSSQWPRLGRAGHEFVARNFQISDLNRRLAGLYTEALRPALNSPTPMR